MVTKPKLTVEERLAAAEARAEHWRGESNRLAVQLFECRQDADMSAGRQIAELKQAQGEAQTLKETLNKERCDRNNEVNGLRSIVRDLELTVERHRGYQDGIADAQPPRMVPEERQTRRDGWPYPQVNSGVDVGVRMTVNAPKPWWHK